MTAPAIDYYVVLDDDDTFSGLEGCHILGIRTSNRRGQAAIDDLDVEEMFDAADVVLPVPAPDASSGGA